MMSDPSVSLVEFLHTRITEDRQRIYRCDGDGEFRVTWLTFRHRDGSMDYTTVAADHRQDVWIVAAMTNAGRSPEDMIAGMAQDVITETARLSAMPEPDRYFATISRASYGWWMQVKMTAADGPDWVSFDCDAPRWSWTRRGAEKAAARQIRRRQARAEAYRFDLPADTTPRRQHTGS